MFHQVPSWLQSAQATSDGVSCLFTGDPKTDITHLQKVKARDQHSTLSLASQHLLLAANLPQSSLL
jgi:hypothetical protein